MNGKASERLGAKRKLVTAGGVAIWMALLIGSPVWASTNPDQPPTALAVAVGEAVGSWSQFTATGELEVLRSSFVVGGPQWRQFVSEAAGSAALDPRQFLVHEIRLRRLDARTATVWAEVEVSQPGRIAQTFGWDFDFILEGRHWLVWTVVAGDRPKDSEMPAEARPPATTPTTETLAPSVPPGHHVEALSGPPEAAGTRIPALSAWIVVVTVIGVAVAGYVAPRLDRRRQ
jgi:hypothetical protein